MIKSARRQPIVIKDKDSGVGGGYKLKIIHSQGKCLKSKMLLSKVRTGKSEG